MMSALAAQVAAHEAGHAAAALLLGRRLLYVSRNRANCGETYSVRAPGDWDPLTTVVVLLAPMYVAPHFLAQHDLGVAKGLREDYGLDVAEAYRRAGKLAERPDFRRAFRAIEAALWSHPVLTGEEAELVVAAASEGKERT